MTTDEALAEASAFLSAAADIGDPMPLDYPYALPPGHPPLPRLTIGAFRALHEMAGREHARPHRGDGA